MKMIARDGSNLHLLELKERLEDNGIPAVIHGENTARMFIPFFLFQPTLWIYLDEQYEDASQLIVNSEHTVKTKINVEAFYKEQPNEVEQRNELNAALIHLALFVGLLMAGMFIFVKVLEWFS